MKKIKAGFLTEIHGLFLDSRDRWTRVSADIGGQACSRTRVSVSTDLCSIVIYSVQLGKFEPGRGRKNEG